MTWLKALTLINRGQLIDNPENTYEDQDLARLAKEYRRLWDRQIEIQQIVNERFSKRLGESV